MNHYSSNRDKTLKLCETLPRCCRDHYLNGIATSLSELGRIKNAIDPFAGYGATLQEISGVFEKQKSLFGNLATW